MSRFVVSQCSLWCKTGALTRLFSVTRMPLKQDTAYYRHSQSNKGFRKLHRRVINERMLQEQLDIMKLSVADLETADSFGSLSVDCDVDEELEDLVKADKPVPTPAYKRRKPGSSEVSIKRGQHSHVRHSFSDRQVADDGDRELADGPYRLDQPVSKRSREHTVSEQLEVSNQANEHSQIYNKFSGKKSLPDVRPGQKDWSEKFGSLSDDVDKFLDKYVTDARRYSCHLVTYLFFSNQSI